MKKSVFSHIILLSALGVSLLSSQEAGRTTTDCGRRIPSDPIKLKAVQSGKVATANALWWGFDPSNSTQSLQAAINSGTPELVVPNVGAPWIVDQINLRSGLKLVIEEGVVILARKGGFLGQFEVLFSAKGLHDVSMIGRGATLRMHRDDYCQAPYKKSEWRHAIRILGCRNVVIEGVRIVSSGGDGIYIGSSDSMRYCEYIDVNRVACDSNLRQGISVISARHLKVRNSLFTNTRGTRPEAGIDFEPNLATEMLEDCTVQGCSFTFNAGAGISIGLFNLSAASPSVSISIESSKSQDNSVALYCAGTEQATSPKGVIRFKGNLIEGKTEIGDLRECRLIIE
jgi:hypothetical protein